MFNTTANICLISSHSHIPWLFIFLTSVDNCTAHLTDLFWNKDLKRSYNCCIAVDNLSLHVMLSLLTYMTLHLQVLCSCKINKPMISIYLDYSSWLQWFLNHLQAFISNFGIFFPDASKVFGVIFVNTRYTAIEEHWELIALEIILFGDCYLHETYFWVPVKSILSEF